MSNELPVNTVEHNPKATFGQHAVTEKIASDGQTNFTDYQMLEAQ